MSEATRTHKIKTKDKHIVGARKAFAARLVKLMEQQDLTQADLSRMLKVSRSAVNWWAGAAAYPSLENAQRLADVLRTTPEYLLFNAEKKSKDRLSDSIPVIDRVDGKKTIITRLMLPREFLTRAKLHHTSDLKAVTIFSGDPHSSESKETIVVADTSDKALSTRTAKLMVIDQGDRMSIGTVRRHRAKRGEVPDVTIRLAGEEPRTGPLREGSIVGRAAAFLSTDP